MAYQTTLSSRQGVTRQPQAGLTLLEVLFALFVLSSTLVMAFPALLNFNRLAGEKAADAYLASVASALKVKYTQASGKADIEDYKLYLDEGAPLVSPGATSSPEVVKLRDLMPQVGGCNEAQRAVLRGIVAKAASGNRTGPGPAALSCVLVSKRIPTSAEGITVPYHNMAIVWPGKDAVFAPGSEYNFVTGRLKLEGDDRGAVVDGREIQEKKVHQTLAQMRRVRDLYEDYFTIRYLSDPDPMVGRNYFYEREGDDGGDDAGGALVRSTLGRDTRARVVLERLLLSHANAGSRQTLVAQLTTPWGTEVEVANRTTTALLGGAVPSVRSPGGSDFLGQTPYTAVIAAQIPGGDDVTFDSYAYVTAIGRY